MVRVSDRNRGHESFKDRFLFMFFREIAQLREQFGEHLGPRVGVEIGHQHYDLHVSQLGDFLFPECPILDRFVRIGFWLPGMSESNRDKQRPEQ